MKTSSRFSASALKLLLFLLPFFVLLVSFFVKDKKTISILCILDFALLAAALLANKTKAMSFSFFFVSLMFIFHCGYCLLWAFDFPFNEGVLNLIDEETWIFAIRLSMCFLFLCSLGIVLCNLRLSKERKKNGTVTAETVKRIGIFFVSVFLLPRLYIDIRYLMAGYLNAFKLDINGFVEVFAEGFYIGLLFLMVGYSSDRKNRRRVLIIGLLFCIFGMLSGRRQEKVAYVTGMVFFYYSVSGVKKHMFLKGASLFAVVYLLLALVATFGDLRRSQNPTLDLYFATLFRNMGYKMLFEQIEEFGYASYTLAATVKCFSSTGSGLGRNYLLTFLEILPQFGQLSKITANLSFVKQIPAQYYYWLGGSLLGELYYNFGVYCVLFFLPLGYCVGAISNKISLAIIDGKIYRTGIISIVCVGPMFLWIRGSFSYLPRTITWMALLALFLSSMIGPKRRLLWGNKYGQRKNKDIEMVS